MDVTSALRAFARTIERGSMTGAADDLGVSQPAISKHLANLERHVKARLLERSPRHVRATAAGQALYEATRSGLAAIDAAMEGIRVETGAIEGSLRIHAQSCVGGKVIHPIVMAFQRDHPNVSVDLVLENRAIDLVFDNFDMAIRYSRPENQDVVVRKIGTVERLLVASPAFLDAVGGIDSPGRLEGMKLVTTAQVISPRKMLTLTRNGVHREIPVQPFLHTNDANVILNTLLAGHACGPIQTLFAGEALRDGRLVRVLPDYAVSSAEMVLAYPSVRFMRPVVRAFADRLIADIKSIDGVQ
ncbi:LysR family transcriptional regulator [Fulvimarina sp. 2208YS6-2-32]|uniref:LysR family transcriptional regulator n=1 Tax=Fulvimarina uroteuthidis TaxID=3098149 RepID=A0ABU5I093_9HYPH|nr:LysR family transcriptional regulator [Fulvimarina sp. 2208YS6-2-32]MDY8107586.1 LysR family transcriptional regulator [Fulvimarina sp. 2208YS6-2-32]